MIKSIIFSFSVFTIFFLPLFLTFKNPTSLKLYNNYRSLYTCDPLYLKINGKDNSNPKDDSNRRVISPDDIYSLFSNDREKSSKPTTTSDEAYFDDYEYDYSEDDIDTKIEMDSTQDVNKNVNNLNSNLSEKSSEVDSANNNNNLVRDVTKEEKISPPSMIQTPSKKILNKYVVDESLLDLVNLENQYHASRFFVF